MAATLKGLNDPRESINLSPGPGAGDTDLKRENLDLLEKRRQDVVSSAGDVRRAFFVFGAFSLYLIITVSSTTHLQLLTGTVFKLPILSVDIPILGFYIALPLLYMLAHFNLMGELKALSEDVRRLKEHLAVSRLPLRERIPFGPARMLIQPDDGSAPRAMINIVTSLAIAVLPPLILLLVQIRFLPYHSEWATLLHRGIIAIDILLVLFLWYPLKFAFLESLKLIGANRLPRRERWLAQSRAAWRAGWQWFELAFCWFVMLFVLVVSIVWVTVPDSSWEKFWLDEFEERGLDVTSIGNGLADTTGDGLPDWTYHGVTPAKRKMLASTFEWFEAPESWHWMRRNLIVSHKDLVAARPSDEVLFFLEGEELKEDEEREKDVWEQGSRGLDLRGRNLRYAVFSHSDLHKADLRGADLEGAVFFKTKLRFADLGDVRRAELGRCADDPLFEDQLDDGPFRETKIIRGNKLVFCRTNLRHATLQDARMQHARLWDADLRKANLAWVHLQYANLGHADLRDATLEGAKLESANLGDVSASRANFKDAKLKHAKMSASANHYAMCSGGAFEKPGNSGYKSIQGSITSASDPLIRDKNRCISFFNQ
ncbi:MAG: pentapeptide repeat-containing protein [Geminicoccaceae bacterium]